jgi:hypothetical protein
MLCLKKHYIDIMVELYLISHSATQSYFHLQVGVVSDYDLLALDSISGSGLTGTNTSMFPEVDSTWKTFREIQRLLSKTNGKVIADVMTYSPLAVRESTNLDAATRYLQTVH